MNATSAHILVVDDELFIRNAFKLYLETCGYEVSTCACGESALRKLLSDDSTIDLVLLDLVMPGLHGLDLLRKIKNSDPSVEVIIATGCGSMSSAIEALRLGAFDYITKPIIDFDRDLLTVIDRALTRRRERLEQLPEAESLSEDRMRATASFYTALEVLTDRIFRATSRKNAFSLVDEFLHKHFRAQTCVVAEHTANSLEVRYAWGTVAQPDGQEFTSPTEEQTRTFWLPLLQQNDNWQQTEPNAVVPKTIAKCGTPLDVLRVPLTVGDEEQQQVGTTSLFIFRQPQVKPDEVPIPAAIAALIVNAAIAMGEVHACL